MSRKPKYKELELRIKKLEALESERKKDDMTLQRLFDLSIDMLCVADIDGYFKFINKAFEETLGYTKEELLNEPFVEFVHPDDRSSTISTVEKLSKGAPAINFDNRYRCKDGSFKWLSWTSMPDIEEGLTYAVARDISERKRIEEEIVMEKNLSESIMSSLPGVFYAFDTEGKFLRWNKNLEDVTGYSAEEISSMSPLDFFEGEDKQYISDRIKVGFSKGESNAEALLVSKNGNSTSHYFTGTRVDIGGKSYLLGMGIDITERRRTEEALREAELIYRTVADFTYDWEYWLGLDGELRYISPSVERITGYQAQEFIDNPVLLREIVVPGDRESWDKHLHEFNENLGSREIQFRIMRRDGKICWIEHACIPVKDNEGGKLGFRASNRDITDRKKAEEALRRITKAVDSASDAIGMSDPQGHHFYQNTAFTDLFEYTAEELEAAGGGPAVYADPDIARDVFKNITSGKSWSGEIEMLSKSGRKFPVDLQADAIKDDKGEIIGIMGVHKDISERKQAEESLKREKAFSDSIIDSLPGIFYFFDNKGKFLRWNKNFEDISEYSAEEISTMNPLDFFNEKDKAKVAERIRETFVKRRSSVEAVILSKSGKKFCFFLTGVLVMIDNANYVVGMGIDISKRKRAEAALKESAEKIKLFAYSVSHDLKNPTIGIHLLTKRLYEKYKDNLNEEGKYHCDLILKASEQLSNLVEQINIYISTKEAPLNIENVNLNQVFDTVRDEFASRLTVRQINLVQPENLPDIHVDRISVLRAVRNFVDNALKYGGDELSEIEIGYEQSEAFHIISVRDDGIGISEEDSKKIFSPFKRSLTSIGTEGSGLGLSIAHEIANQHKGKVWAEFGSEKGITFYMSFSKDLELTK